jgi:sugar phosphate isomerase/epimerase
VHLGGAGSAIYDEEKQLRHLYDEGECDGERVEGLRAQAAARRHEDVPRFFPNARRSLAEIAEYAAPRGVAIGLENRYHYHEFPDPDEMQELLADYPPEVAGFWIDIGHAEVLDRLGFHHRHRWLNEVGKRCIGSHVHDVDGLADHRAPGHGTADWAHYSAKLPAAAPRVFEINQKQPDEWVAEAIPYLRSVGVLP